MSEKMKEKAHIKIYVVLSYGPLSHGPHPQWESLQRLHIIYTKYLCYNELNVDFIIREYITNLRLIID